MYSIVLALVLTGSGDVPALGDGQSCIGCSGCHGCDGSKPGLLQRLFHSRGCHGGVSCHGCTGCCGGSAVIVQPAAPAKAEPVPAPAPQEKPEKKAAAAAAPATITVVLPAETRLFIDDQETKAVSTQRVFVTPELKSGRTYNYTLRAELVRDGKTHTETREVAVTPGENSQVSFAGLGVSQPARPLPTGAQE